MMQWSYGDDEVGAEAGSSRSSLANDQMKFSPSDSSPLSSNTDLTQTHLASPSQSDSSSPSAMPKYQAPILSRDERLFHQWRPKSHLLAPHGWMNDPCGPSYDPRTGLYHMWYQWNPKGSTWGNMSWGHAYSTDLIRWKSSTDPVIEPGKNHDHEGVFTGAVLHRSPLGLPEEAAEDGEMTAIYTAVSLLPIHHTLPYNHGCEKVVLSTSTDGGQTWTPHGVILPGPPEEEKVISWRDPYISEWPLLDAILGRSQPGLYALIAGGIKDVTPTIFAYSVDPTDLSSWEYIGTLCDLGQNIKSAPHGVDLGKNWEVANFFTLGDASSAVPADRNEYLLINAEGCVEPGPHRAAVYMKLDVQNTQLGQRGISLQPAHVGFLDHGSLYAASSFHDQAKNRRIMWGWITEDDLPESYYETQGWAGCISLPRELFSHPASDELGIRPAKEVESLRVDADHRTIQTSELSASQASSNNVVTLQDGRELKAIGITGVDSRSMEVVIDLDDTIPGVVVAHDDDLSTRTLVYISQQNELVVDRSQSAGKTSVLAKGIEVNTSMLEAKIPSTVVSEAKTGTTPTTTTKHTMRLFVDNSVLEIFVDDLIVLSTRIYPDELDNGFSILASPHHDLVTRQSQQPVHVWSGLSKAHLGFI